MPVRRGDSAVARARLQQLRVRALAPTAETDPEPVPELADQPTQHWRFNPGSRGFAAIALVGAAAAGLAVAGFVRSRPHVESAPVATTRPVATATPSPTASGLVVDVIGKVRHPGLVTLPSGSRVADAISAAGGLLPGAQPGLLNLARKLSDGEQVAVGVAGEGGPSGTSGSASGVVDLNAATVDQLDALPGVGPVLAQRIVDWRTAHGGFTTVDQLHEVSGIGDAKFSQLRAHVTV